MVIVILYKIKFVNILCFFLLMSLMKGIFKEYLFLNIVMLVKKEEG